MNRKTYVGTVGWLLMNDSDLSRIQPHQEGLFAACLLGGGAVVFALVAVALLLSGNESFRVVAYGLGIENQYIRIAILPFVAFCGGYLFAFSVSTLINLIARHRESSN